MQFRARAAAHADATGVVALDIARREIARILLNSGCNSSQLMFTFTDESASDGGITLHSGVSGGVGASCGPTVRTPEEAPTAAAATVTATATARPTHMRVCVPEAWLEIIRVRVWIVADAQVLLTLGGRRPGLRVSVAELVETDLIKHLPEPEHGRRASTVLRHCMVQRLRTQQMPKHSRAADVPTREVVSAPGLTRPFCRYSRWGIIHAAAARAALCRWGEGASAEVTAGGCRHDLREGQHRRRDSRRSRSCRSLLVGLQVVTPHLCAVFISNPSLSSTIPVGGPRLELFSSARALPGPSAHGAAEPDVILPFMIEEQQHRWSPSTSVFYRIVAAKDDAPRPLRRRYPIAHILPSCSVEEYLARGRCLAYLLSKARDLRCRPRLLQRRQRARRRKWLGHALSMSWASPRSTCAFDLVAGMDQCLLWITYVGARTAERHLLPKAVLWPCYISGKRVVWQSGATRAALICSAEVGFTLQAALGAPVHADPAHLVLEAVSSQDGLFPR